MNPLKIIRWPVVIVLAVLGFASQKLAIGSYVDRKIEAKLQESFQTSARVDKVELALSAGTMKISGVRVDDPIDKSKWLLQADTIDIEFDPAAFLTRRLIAKHIDIKSPKAAVARKDTGEDTELPGMSDDEVLRRAREIYDKVGKAKDWYDKVRNILAKLKAKREVDDKRAAELAKFETEFPEVGPRLIIERISVDGIDIDFQGDPNLPKLVGGSLVAASITNKPAWYKDPMHFVLGSRMNDPAAGPAFKVQAGFAPDGSMNWAGLLDSIPVQQISALCGDSLPLKLLDGKVSVAWNGKFMGLDRFELAPNLIFENLKVEPKPEIAKIAGFAAPLLSKEFTLAGKFALTDIRIHGDPMNPEIELGNTIPTLMKMGGEAFAKQFGSALADHLLGQLRGKIPGGESVLGIPSALLGTALGGGDVGKALEGALSENLGSILGSVAGGNAENPADKMSRMIQEIQKGGGLGGVLNGMAGPKTAPGKAGGADPLSELLGGVIGPKKAPVPALGEKTIPDHGKPTPGVPDVLDTLMKGQKPKDGTKPPESKPTAPNPLDILNGLAKPEKKKPAAPASQPAKK